jgi:hypothetical protein
LSGFRSTTLIINSILTHDTTHHNLHLSDDSVIALKSAPSFSDGASASGAFDRSAFGHPTGKQCFWKWAMTNGRRPSWVTPRDRRS